MKQVTESLNRRDVLQLAAMFGLTLTVPSLAAQSTAQPLTTDEMTLIGEVSELIIPTTDTGGALAAGAPDFVKMMLAGWFTAAERDNFMAGLRDFSAGARRQYGKPFAQLSAQQKDEYFGGLLAAAEAPRAASGSARPAHAPFVVLMKRLTIFGYYTSEIGATKELQQRIAVAQYEPAAVIQPGERADSGIPSAMYPFNAG